MGSGGREAHYLFQLPGAQLKGGSPFPPNTDFGIMKDEEPRTPNVRGLVFHKLQPSPGVEVRGEQAAL